MSTHFASPRFKTVLLYTPVLLAVLLMLPRLAQPHFGLLDDGRTLAVARQINQGTWDMSWDTQSGRYRPVYWLVPAAEYRLFGPQPGGFFAVNVLLLALTAAEIVALARKAGGTPLQAGLAGGFFVFSGPVIESYYTLSKSEPVLLALLGLALLLGLRSAQAERVGPRLGWGGLASLAVLAACLAKETALALLPVSLAWLACAGLWRMVFEDGRSLRAPALIFWTALLGGGVFLLLRSAALGQYSAGGSYTSQVSFSPGHLLAAAKGWSAWLLRGYLYLLPLLGGAGLALLLGRNPAARKTSAAGAAAGMDAARTAAGSGLALAAALWAGLWWAAFLPWIFSQEYYLLPSAAGAACLAGVLAAWLLAALRRPGRAVRMAAALSLALAGLTWLALQGNNLTNARVQLATDRADASLLAYLAAQAPPNGLVFLNIQSPNEVVEETGIYLNQVLGRPDLGVDFIRFEAPNPGAVRDGRPVLIAVPVLLHQPPLSVRLGYVENTQAHWNEGLFKTLEPAWQPVYRLSSSFPMLGFNLPRLACWVLPGFGTCSEYKPVVDRRSFSYGWDVYAVQTP